jgi:translation initiation factor 2B subunit (eIF-2B alpha/beta/delta family)
MDQASAEIVLEMASCMEESAEQGDWDRVEEISHQLKAAIMRVPETQRFAPLQAARRSLERVHARAESARLDVTGKLSKVRRGRDAAKAYGTTY